MILHVNTKRIHNSFRRNFFARAKQMASKVLFVGKKNRRQRPFGHCALNCNRWQRTVNELEVINNYSPQCRWLVVDI